MSDSERPDAADSQAARSDAADSQAARSDAADKHPPTIENEHPPFEPPVTTSELPAPGGHIGPDVTHFEVEEIPAYEPSGEGDHLYLWVEKRGENTREVARRIGRVAGINDRDVGYAGMKDRHAVTRQWFSLLAPREPSFPIEQPSSWDLGEGVVVLKVTRHKNKLRTGHLIGNRFAITLVGGGDGALGRAEAITKVLTTRGLANFYGPQRFGREGRNLAQAFAWLEGEVAAAEAAAADTVAATGADGDGSGTAGEVASKGRGKKRGKRRGRHARGPDPKMLSSVLQSELFNRYLARRLAMTDELIEGEAVRLDNTGTHFVVEDVEAELPRLRANDLHLTGAMIGPKTLQSAAAAQALEQEVASELGLDEKLLQALARHAPGARRDLYLHPEGLTVAEAPDGIALRFTLPAGAFATQICREYTRDDWLNPRA